MVPTDRESDLLSDHGLRDNLLNDLLPHHRDKLSVETTLYGATVNTGGIKS